MNSISKQKHITMFCTCPNVETAEKISKILLEKKLIACANILPEITSHYWWDGDIRKDSEVLTIMKSREELFPSIREEILKVHPYSVPEIIALPILHGSESYLRWIDVSTGETSLYN